MTKAENQRSKTPWIIGAILAVLVLIIGFMVSLPLMIAAVIGGTESNRLANNGCYAQTVSGDGLARTADGITGQKLGPSGYSDEQLKNARIIDQAAKDLGLSGQATVIAITAAFGESTLYNIGYGDEAQGVKNPDGTATTSKGLFQQQTSMGWGTAEEVTNPEYAAKTFLTGKNHNGTGSGLVSVPGWETMEVTNAINKVQANADPNHYARFYSNANEIIDIIKVDRDRPADEAKQKKWKNGNAPAPDADHPADTANNVSCDSGLNTGKSQTIAGKPAKNTYPWGEYGDNKGIVTPPGDYAADPMGFYYGECTSFAAWKVNEAMGGSKTNIIFNNSYGGARKGNGAEWKAAWEANGWKVSNKPVPGAVAWWGANGGDGIGSAGHVAWVTDVTDDGKAIIEEYNNGYYAPPGHKYNVRPKPVDPSEVGAFLYLPPKK